MVAQRSAVPPVLPNKTHDTIRCGAQTHEGWRIKKGQSSACETETATETGVRGGGQRSDAGGSDVGWLDVGTEEEALTRAEWRVEGGQARDERMIKSISNIPCPGEGGGRGRLGRGCTELAEMGAGGHMRMRYTAVSETLRQVRCAQHAARRRGVIGV